MNQKKPSPGTIRSSWTNSEILSQRTWQILICQSNYWPRWWIAANPAWSERWKHSPESPRWHFWEPTDSILPTNSSPKSIFRSVKSPTKQDFLILTTSPQASKNTSARIPLRSVENWKDYLKKGTPFLKRRAPFPSIIYWRKWWTPLKFIANALPRKNSMSYSLRLTFLWF